MAEPARSDHQPAGLHAAMRDRYYNIVTGLPNISFVITTMIFLGTYKWSRIGKNWSKKSNNCPIMSKTPKKYRKTKKRSRGRPKGSRDSAPRRPRKTVIIEHTEEPPPRARAAAPAHSQAPEAAAPPSPRSLFRLASEHITSLHAEKEKARRAYWEEAIHKSLR